MMVDGFVMVLTLDVGCGLYIRRCIVQMFGTRPPGAVWGGEGGEVCTVEY